MDKILSETIKLQRKLLIQFLSPIMKNLAQECAVLWDQSPKMSKNLEKQLQPWATVSFGQRLYTVTPDANLYGEIASSSNYLFEVNSNEQEGMEKLLLIPYLAKVESSQLKLTEVYLGRVLHKSCITAIQAITIKGVVVGYLVADFELRKLPQEERAFFPKYTWRQIKGDPAIRKQLFQQKFIPGAIDQYIDDVLNILDELLIERGVFRVSLHFPSSRATLWVTEDPYDEHTHVLQEILDPSICLAYPKRDYPDGAKVTTDMVRPILNRFRELRYADDV
ncbi:MAG: hypothetical protein HN848_04970, partial [Thiotrichales bacterium]|nr:hypothetical protein [Thiotrichales bacterium]